MHLERKIKKLKEREARFQNLLERFRNIRLTIFFFFLGIIFWISISEVSTLKFLALILSLGIFITLVRITHNISRYISLLKYWSDFLNRQRHRIIGSYSCSSNPKFNLNALAIDLNLHGEASIFSQINECMTDGASQRLGGNLLNPDLTFSEIAKRQKIAQEMTSHSWPLLKLKMRSSLSPALQPHQLLIDLSHPVTSPAFLKKLGWAWVLFFVSALSTLLYRETSMKWVFIFTFAYPIYIYFCLDEISAPFQKSLRLEYALESFLKFLKAFESQPRLKKFLPSFESLKILSQIKRLNRAVSLISIASHPFVFLIVNFLIPWNFTFSWLLEKRRSRLVTDLKGFLDDLFEFEIQMSFAFLKTFQQTAWPNVKSSKGFNIDKAYHPLLGTQRVPNSFHFAPKDRISLISGSNMSGKSTFLKTIALNQALAQIGAPVFAQSFETSVYQIATIIRIQDSLEDGFSFFYSELLKIKGIIESKEDKPVLYFVDEILKGTNNRERLQGATRIIEKLSTSNHFGFITTHDLELTELSKKIPTIVNYHFNEDWQGEKMVFPYTIKAGPCQTTNALALMKHLSLI